MQRECQVFLHEAGHHVAEPGTHRDATGQCAVISDRVLAQPDSVVPTRWVPGLYLALADTDQASAPADQGRLREPDGPTAKPRNGRHVRRLLPRLSGLLRLLLDFLQLTPDDQPVLRRPSRVARRQRDEPFAWLGVGLVRYW
jgi:hypothetical protein